MIGVAARRTPTASATSSRPGAGLRHAREKFARCARDECPSIVVGECATFLRDAERAQPTVVLGARDAAGHDAVGVHVLLDGAPFGDATAGRALPVDPGDHVLRFVDASGAFVEQRVVIREGDKDRQVIVDFPRAGPRVVVQPAPSPPPRSGARTAAYVVGGAGLASLAVFTGFGISAAMQAHTLDTTCSPHCGARIDDVHAMRTQALVADVALVGGAVLLSTAVVLWFAGAPARASDASAARTLAAAPRISY